LVEGSRAAGAEVWQPPDACPVDGWFYPPTLVTGVGPASEPAQVKVSGPVLVAMSLRTPAEAVALANNTRYGLAASVWTQDIDQALDVARAIQAGTVWINSTNLFDASSGFGRYRESGWGREGGPEGLWEYVRPTAPTSNRHPAENLSVRAKEFAARVEQMTGKDGTAEVQQAIEKLFEAAAWADKFEGRVHTPPMRGAALAVPEPIGVVGVACPIEQPLFGFI